MGRALSILVFSFVDWRVGARSREREERERVGDVATIWYQSSRRGFGFVLNDESDEGMSLLLSSMPAFYLVGLFS